MQTVGLNRNTIDKYYTKPEIVNQCVNAFIKYVSLDKNNDVVIEPSAGNGSFIPAIKAISNNCVFYDLEPEHPEIQTQDYLTLNVANPSGLVHVIGNPLLVANRQWQSSSLKNRVCFAIRCRSSCQKVSRKTA